MTKFVEVSMVRANELQARAGVTMIASNVQRETSRLVDGLNAMLALHRLIESGDDKVLLCAVDHETYPCTSIRIAMDAMGIS